MEIGAERLKIEPELPYDRATPLSPEDTTHRRDAYISPFFLIIFITAKTWTSLEVSHRSMWPFTQQSFTELERTKIMLQTELEIVTLSKIRQTQKDKQKDKHHVLSHVK